jgi:hypothetical protein
MSKLYMNFLKALDTEIEKSSPEHREQIKILFLQAWYNTFPNNSIAQFMENFKKIRHRFSLETRYKAAILMGRALSKLSLGVK